MLPWNAVLEYDASFNHWVVVEVIIGLCCHYCWISSWACISLPSLFSRTSQLTRHVHKVARQVRSSLTCHKDPPTHPNHPSPIQTTFSTNFGIPFPPSYRGPGDVRPFCASLHRTSICTFVLLNLRPIFSSSINQFDLLWKRN